MLCSRMLIYLEDQAKALEKARDMRSKSDQFLENGQYIQARYASTTAAVLEASWS